MTSVALITTVTFVPTANCSRCTEATVIAETTSGPPSSLTITSAITAPSLTAVTVPGNWLRALSCMNIAPFDCEWRHIPRSSHQRDTTCPARKDPAIADRASCTGSHRLAQHPPDDKQHAERNRQQYDRESQCDA